jgi:hypothetical protein
MPRGAHRQWGSRFCLGMSCLGSRDSQREFELSGNERSTTGLNGAATSPLPTPALNLPSSVRVNRSGEAGPEPEDVDDTPIIAGRRTSETHLPPPPLKYSGPSLASFTAAESQISRANSLGLRNSQKDADLSENQLSGTKHNGAAKGLLLAPTPTSVRLDNPGEARLERDDIPIIVEHRKPETHLSPSWLKFSTPSFAPSTTLDSQISRAHSSPEDPHEQGRVDAETPIAAEEPPPPSGHASSSELVTKLSRKKKAITFAKTALQVAAAGLKAAPIPNLDQIPNVLLSLIQTYEVSHLAASSPQTILSNPSLDYGWEQRETSRPVQINRPRQRYDAPPPSVLRRYYASRDQQSGKCTSIVCVVWLTAFAQ